MKISINQATVSGFVGGQFVKEEDHRDKNYDPKWSPIKYLLQEGNMDYISKSQGFFLTPEQCDGLKEKEVFTNPQGLVFVYREQFENEPKRWGKLYVLCESRKEIKLKDSDVVKLTNLEPMYDSRYDRDSEYFQSQLEYQQCLRFNLEIEDEVMDAILEERENVIESAFEGERV